MGRKAKALHAAVAAIYLKDSSDYLPALWQVVSILDPKMACLLQKNELQAYKKSLRKSEKNNK